MEVKFSDQLCPPENKLTRGDRVVRILCPEPHTLAHNKMSRDRATNQYSTRLFAMIYYMPSFLDNANYVVVGTT